MTCQSCQRDPGAGPLCLSCGALQPLPRPLDAFAALGLAPSFFVDARRVEERFRELNRRLHPDRFAQRSAPERRLSLEWTTAVNDAARIVRDPLRRAAALLRARGVDVEKESGRGAMQRLPPAFLDEVLEVRERLAAAAAAHDLARVRALAQVQRERVGAVEAELAKAFEALERAPEPSALERAAAAVAVLRYHARFEEEVEAIELRALEQG